VPVRKYPPIGVDTSSTPIKLLAVQTWAICVLTSPWVHGSPV
jgi:hypothetical protein